MDFFTGSYYFVPEGIHDRRALGNSPYISINSSICDLTLCVLDVGLAGCVLLLSQSPAFLPANPICPLTRLITANPRPSRNAYYVPSLWNPTASINDSHCKILFLAWGSLRSISLTPEIGVLWCTLMIYIARCFMMYPFHDLHCKVFHDVPFPSAQDSPGSTPLKNYSHPCYRSVA